MEVHPPSEAIHNWKQFFLHLITITIGLLIAVGIEGIVEWQHHRHLVHEAEVGLHAEIMRNSAEIPSIRQQIQSAQRILRQDLDVLHSMLKDPKDTHGSMSLSFSMQSFDNVSWKTAQATGAFTYMPLEDARQFSDIYDTQDQLFKVEQQEVDDVMQAAALVVTERKDENPAPQTIDLLATRIGLIQMRLQLIDSLINSLDNVYKKYEAKHSHMADASS